MNSLRDDSPSPKPHDPATCEDLSCVLCSEAGRDRTLAVEQGDSCVPSPYTKSDDPLAHSEERLRKLPFLLLVDDGRESGILN